MSDWRVCERPDLNFVIRGQLHPNELSVDIEVYAVMGVQEDGKCLLMADSEQGSPEPADTFDEADVYMHGFVKWDGCSHFMFNDNAKNCMLHVCGPDAARDLAGLFPAVMALAKDMLGDKAYPDCWKERRHAHR